MNKILAYARVSSSDQNLDRQLIALNEAGYTDLFTDKVSGKNINRDGLNDLIKGLRSGDTVLVKSLDRLGRSTLDILTLIQQWADSGIGLTILDNTALSYPAGNGLDPMQKMMLAVMASVAELERNMIKERQREGIEAAIAKGVKFGRARSKGEAVTPEQAKQALEDHAGNKMQAAKSLDVNRTTFYRLIAA